jgi:hypothetical protein
MRSSRGGLFVLMDPVFWIFSQMVIVAFLKAKKQHLGRRVLAHSNKRHCAFIAARLV